MKESEETEVKSKQELIEKWESAIEAADFYGKGKEDRLISYMRDFVDDLNQLDEREQLEIAYKDILSRGEFWFDGKWYKVVEKEEPLSDGEVKLIVGFYGGTESYSLNSVDEALETLTDYGSKYEIVPKQEKVEVPRFVADILEGNTFADLPTAFEELFSANAGHYYGEDVCKWIVSNEEDFARAWLDGFTVEQEQKYYVLNKELQPMLCKSAGMSKKILESNTEFTINEKGLYKKQYQLTEQEIKDYDPRYMAFAKLVEELEE